MNLTYPRIFLQSPDGVSIIKPEGNVYDIPVGPWTAAWVEGGVLIGAVMNGEGANDRLLHLLTGGAPVIVAPLTRMA